MVSELCGALRGLGMALLMMRPLGEERVELWVAGWDGDGVDVDSRHHVVTVPVFQQLCRQSLFRRAVQEAVDHFEHVAPHPDLRAFLRRCGWIRDLTREGVEPNPGPPEDYSACLVRPLRSCEQPSHCHTKKAASQPQPKNKDAAEQPLRGKKQLEQQTENNKLRGWLARQAQQVVHAYIRPVDCPRCQAGEDHFHVGAGSRQPKGEEDVVAEGLRAMAEQEAGEQDARAEQPEHPPPPPARPRPPTRGFGRGGAPRRAPPAKPDSVVAKGDVVSAAPALPQKKSAPKRAPPPRPAAVVVKGKEAPVAPVQPQGGPQPAKATSIGSPSAKLEVAAVVVEPQVDAARIEPPKAHLEAASLVPEDHDEEKESEDGEEDEVERPRVAPGAPQEPIAVKHTPLVDVAVVVERGIFPLVPQSAITPIGPGRRSAGVRQALAAVTVQEIIARSGSRVFTFGSWGRVPQEGHLRNFDPPNPLLGPFSAHRLGARVPDMEAMGRYKDWLLTPEGGQTLQDILKLPQGYVVTSANHRAVFGAVISFITWFNVGELSQGSLQRTEEPVVDRLGKPKAPVTPPPQRPSFDSVIGSLPTPPVTLKTHQGLTDTRVGRAFYSIPPTSEEYRSMGQLIFAVAAMLVTPSQGQVNAVPADAIPGIHLDIIKNIRLATPRYYRLIGWKEQVSRRSVRLIQQLGYLSYSDAPYSPSLFDKLRLHPSTQYMRGLDRTGQGVSIVEQARVIASEFPEFKSMPVNVLEHTLHMFQNQITVRSLIAYGSCVGRMTGPGVQSFRYLGQSLQPQSGVPSGDKPQCLRG